MSRLAGGIVAEKQRVRRTADVSEAGELLTALLGQVSRGQTRLVVQQDGKDVAALVSAYDLEHLEALDRRAAEGWQAIQEIWARNADIDPEEAERDIAEVRAERRAKERAKTPAAPGT
jgi:PHD/YefM family antitoxin component YafN of YafNO toxin-antitoxin module